MKWDLYPNYMKFTEKNVHCFLPLGHWQFNTKKQGELWISVLCRNINLFTSSRGQNSSCGDSTFFFMFLEISLCFYVCGLDSLDLKHRHKTKHDKICHSKVPLSRIRKTDEKKPGCARGHWGASCWHRSKISLWDQANDTLSNVNVTEAEPAHFRVCEGTYEMNKAPA